MAVDEHAPGVRDRLSHELVDGLLAGARTEGEVVWPDGTAGRSLLALSSRGLSVRDIEAYLHEIYGVKIGRDLISRGRLSDPLP